MLKIYHKFRVSTRIFKKNGNIFLYLETKRVIVIFSLPNHFIFLMLYFIRKTQNLIILMGISPRFTCNSHVEN